MVINKNKASNVLTISTAPYGCNEPSLSLTNTATFFEVLYDLTPLTNNNRYISFELPTEELDNAMYSYVLFDGDREVNRGILNVFDGVEEGVITPDNSSFDDEVEYFYNGE